MALVLGQEWELSHRLVRIGGGGRHESSQMFAETLDSGGIEKVRIVGEGATDLAVTNDCLER